MSIRNIFFYLFLGLLFGGCTDVSPTNPYDPAAPEELQRRATLYGSIVVVEGESAQPLEGASMTLSGPTNPENNPRLTAEDGAFRYEELLPGNYQLNVQHGGHLVRDLSISLSAGDSRELRVIMQPLPTGGENALGGRIQGRAHRSGELSLPEAEQDHSGITIEVVGAGIRTVTNQAGQFDLFLNEGSYTLELSTPNYFTLESDEINVVAGETAVLENPIALTPNPGSVTGTVLLEGESESLTDTVVTLVNTASTATTGVDGSFTIDGVAAGTYTLRVARDGFDAEQVAGLVVVGGRQTDAGSVSLAISRGGIRGIATRVNGVNHSGISVQVIDHPYGALTTDDGQYNLDGLPVGDYALRICAQGFEPRQALVTVERDQVSIADPVALAAQQITLTGADTVETTSSPEYTLQFEVPAWTTGIKVTGDLAGDESSDFRPYAGDGRLTVNLSEGDGLKQLSVQFRGDDCQLSEVFELNVLLDRQGPELFAELVGAPVAPNGTFILGQAGGVGLEVNCFDDQSPANDLSLRVTSGPELVLYDGAYRPFIALDLPGDEGVGRLAVSCNDLAGNAPREPVQLRYLLDLTPPIGQLQIGERDPTNDLSPVLSIQASDNRGGSGVARMAAANGALDCETASYEPYRPELPWALPVGDGSKLVSVCLRDRAGNLAAISQRVVLDTTPPAGSFFFAGGAYSSQVSVGVTIRTGDENDVEFTFVSDPAECATAETYQPVVERPRPLVFDGDGQYRVALCLRDAAGNLGTHVETITIDTVPPTGHFAINGGAEYTNETEVEVEITASADVSEMKVAVNGRTNCADEAGYVPVELASTVSLGRDDAAIPDGDKRIDVCVKDRAGHTTQLASKRIFLDRIPPEATANVLPNGIVIAYDVEARGGADVVNQRNTRVTVLGRDPGNPPSAASGLTQFKLTSQPDCLGGAWQEWPQGSDQPHTVDYVLPDGDYAEATVHVCFRDAAGNTSDGDGNPVENADSVFVDTLPFVLNSATLTGTGRNDEVPEPGYTNECEVLIDWQLTGGQPQAGGCIVVATHSVDRQVFTTEKDCGEPAGQVYSGQMQVRLGGDARECRAADGSYQIEVSVRDNAGNISNQLRETIELDKSDPVLAGITITPGEGSDSSSQDLVFTGDSTVYFTLDGANGGTEVRHIIIDTDNLNLRCAQQGLDNCCPPDLDEPGFESTALGLPLSMTGVADGEYLVCAALRDVAGRSSKLRAGLVVVDTEVPDAPVLPGNNLTDVNASCAYVEAESNEIGRNVAGSGFWRYEIRGADGEWRAPTADDLGPGDVLKFRLQQDTDNLLQVRVVDRAGNRSGTSSLQVEEVSSFLVPTALPIKQICNGGQYAILKQKMESPSSYHRPTCESGKTYFSAMPEVALLNLASLTTTQLSPSLDLQDLTNNSCGKSNFDQNIIDAACSPNPDEPALLIARPTLVDFPTCTSHCSPPPADATADNPCPGMAAGTHDWWDNSTADDPSSNAFCRPAAPRIAAIRCVDPDEECINNRCLKGICCRNCHWLSGVFQGVADWPANGNYGSINYIVLPDPIENPLQAYMNLGTHGGESASAAPLSSIDVLDWTGDHEERDYSFVAIGTDTDMVTSRSDGENSRYFRTNVRRIRLNFTPPDPGILDGVGRGFTDPAFSYTVGDLAHQNQYGLSIYSNVFRYLKHEENGGWGIYRGWGSSANPTETGPLANTSGLGDDVADSPYGKSVAAAYWTHLAQNDALGFGSIGNFLYLRTAGATSQAKACGSNNTNCTEANAVLGSGAPAGARIIEAGPGEVFWVDANDNRTFYLSSTYGQNPTRVRYAVDPTQPIFPGFSEDAGPGTPFAIFSTNGVSRGVVVAYRDENDESQGECAQ